MRAVTVSSGFKKFVRLVLRLKIDEHYLKKKKKVMAQNLEGSKEEEN